MVYMELYYCLHINTHARSETVLRSTRTQCVGTANTVNTNQFGNPDVIKTVLSASEKVGVPTISLGSKHFDWWAASVSA
jgi:hypothetical protein